LKHSLCHIDSLSLAKVFTVAITQVYNNGSPPYRVAYCWTISLTQGCQVVISRNGQMNP